MQKNETQQNYANKLQKKLVTLYGMYLRNASTT